MLSPWSKLEEGIFRVYTDMKKKTSNLILEGKHRNLIPDTLLSPELTADNDYRR